MEPLGDLVIGTAGHIDHGKTALVKALTGIDTDRLPAERDRGISIDLGFAALNLGNHAIALVDVPGHERFVRNMLAGATGLDLALLVVAADDSVMPQTREHFEILRLLGLPCGIVALTKCDLVGTDWLAMVEEDVRGLVSGSFLEGAPIIRTSARSGLGLDELRQSLVEVAGSISSRPDPGYFRMAIDRAFTLAGHGTVVTGTVAAGSISVGDELQWWPEGRLVRVRGLHRHDQPVERVGRGTRAAVNLVGVHHTEVHRGQELGESGHLVATRLLSVEVVLSREAPRPLRHRGRYRLHLGTAEVSATLSLFETASLEPNVPQLAQIATVEPVVAVSGQPFVLREASPPTTLGGGRVLAPSPRRIRRRDLAAYDRLDRLRSLDPLVRASAALASIGYRKWSPSTLSRDAGIARDEAADVVETLCSRNELIELPAGPKRTLRLLGEVVTELEDRVVRAIGRLHAARPRQTAIRRSHLDAQLPDLAAEGLVQPLVDRLRVTGRIKADDRIAALNDFRPELSQAERKLKSELSEILRRGDVSPPDLSELQASAGPRADVVPELLALLVDEGEVVEVARNLHLNATTEARMRRQVMERLTEKRGLTLAEIRDLLGTTRKTAVPYAEFLDRIGLTRREGDLRFLHPGAPRGMADV